MLAQSAVMAFVATARPEGALAFYRDTLGLTLVEDTPFALVFDAAGTQLRVQKVEAVMALPYTALGWFVANIEQAVETLGARGVVFERFDGMGQDTQGIWTAPGGARIAWFRDPDGNLLSLAAQPGIGAD